MLVMGTQILKSRGTLQSSGDCQWRFTSPCSITEMLLAPHVWRWHGYGRILCPMPYCSDLKQSFNTLICLKSLAGLWTSACKGAKPRDAALAVSRYTGQQPLLSWVAKQDKGE